MAAKKGARKKAGESTLIVIGGHEDKEGEKNILSEVSRRVGSGKLVVATVATDSPDEVWEEYQKLFKALGVKRIEHLDVREREEALSESRADILDGASVVFFTGGDQLKITSQLGDSKVYQKIEDLLEKGGTIAGTSAGASVMSATMLISGPGDQSPNVNEAIRMAPGLGLLPDIIVDQHFAERGRLGRLIAAIAQNPRYLGVGIDEDTAIVVHDGKSFEVVGSGAVYVLDGSKICYSNLAEEREDRDKLLTVFDVKVHLLAEGYGFDLQERRPMEAQRLAKAS
jgi:cyanophycinase